MKRLLSLLILGLALFYVAWPAYSGYAIKSALDAKDVAGLNQRIDFPSVRNSIRPAVTTKVESTLDAAASKAGPGGTNIYAALKTQLMPKIVEAALDKLVTPEVLIRVNAERVSLKEFLDGLVDEQVAKSGGAGLSGGTGRPGLDVGKVLGGLFGKSGSTSPSPQTKAPLASSEQGGNGVTWRNIKGVGFDGPAGVYISLAKDAAATQADLTAHMSFMGGSWVLTGLEPRL